MSPKTYSESTSDNSYTGRPSREMSLYQCSMSSSETNKYRLRMWVDEEYNPQGDGGSLSFSVQINVYGKDGNPEDLYKTIADTLLTEISEDNLYVDGVDTFITGEDPNNYIWYSGKLWRAVSINNEAKTIKFVTQWAIAVIPYSSGSSSFEGSYMEEWLNDTRVDGFLGNLREPEKFIVMDAKWDATMDDRELGSITRPNGTTVVTDAVGLLNAYEYQASSGKDPSSYTNSYLNDGMYWYTLTPADSSKIRVIHFGLGTFANINISDAELDGLSFAVRPSINLKNDVKIVSGDGTETNPYRLQGDNDSDLSGSLLNTRYSGEYIRFGTGENTLYRIVSHETNGLTKITSAEPLKEAGEFKRLEFDSSGNVNYSTSTTLGLFLNGEYLTSGKYLTTDQVDMIVDNTTWYLGTVGSSANYKLAKYKDIGGNSLTSNITQYKVGLLRLGELMSGQFAHVTTNNVISYYTLTPYSTSTINSIFSVAYKTSSDAFYEIGVKPSMNLKTNVVITGGNGTKNNPFTLELK